MGSRRVLDAPLTLDNIKVRISTGGDIIAGIRGMIDQKLQSVSTMQAKRHYSYIIATSSIVRPFLSLFIHEIT